MEYATVNNMKISRLTLGTAQLGYDYGIANTGGKPDPQKSHKILKLAADNGVNCFDTAPSYGDSEKIIGSFLSSYDNFPEPPVVVTKLTPIKPYGKITFENIYQLVKKQVTESLVRLKIKKIQIYLLHNAADVNAYKGLVTESLLKLKYEGLIGIPGVSIYDPEEVAMVLKSGTMQAIQVPINIFDHRFIKTGLLEQLKKKGFIIFARSIFLQGLFFLRAGKLPPHLAIAEPYLKKLQKLASNHGTGIAELALTFVRDLPAISSVVTGAETPEQVRQNIELMKSPPMPLKLREETMSIFSNVPREIVDPRTWSPGKTGGTT